MRGILHGVNQMSWKASPTRLRDEITIFLVGNAPNDGELKVITYSLFKHKDGRSPNYYCLYQHPVSEKRLHFSCRTSDVDEAHLYAKRKLPLLVQKMIRESHTESTTPTQRTPEESLRMVLLSEYKEEFIRSHITKSGQSYRPSSRRVVRDGFHRLIDRIGDVYLHAVTNEQAHGFIHSGQPTLRTAEKHLINLRSAFRSAVERGYLRSNPFADVPCPKPSYTDEEIEERCFNPEDFEVFIQRMKSKTPAQQRLRRMLMLVFETGLRLGEIRNLRSVRCDMDRKVIKVASNRTFRPKTKISSRTIPLSETALRVITDQQSANTCSDNVSIRDSPYLFPGPTGDVLSESAIHTPLRKERTRIFGADSKARIHGLRHAFVTRLSLHGVTDRQIQEISGHSSLEMIQRYSHMSERLVEPIRKALNETTISFIHHPLQKR